MAKPPKKPFGLSSGSTLLNLACSGNALVAFLIGKYYFLVGDSTSGKTFLSLTCMAEAARNKRFDGYRFIFDDVEDGALMDYTQFFGAEMAERIEPPAWDEDGKEVHSETIEDMYYHIDDAIQHGAPFIYVTDSMDALTSEAEAKKFEEKKKARRGGKVTTGTMSDGKAKINASHLRKIMAGLKSTGSILIIISQTRDNINPMSFETKTRSGGRALKFYATLEMWSSVAKKLKKTVRGKPRTVGINAKVMIKKNRITGRNRIIEMPIHYTYGIDDIGSCIAYLLDEGHWKKSGASIKAPEFDFVGSEKQLVRQIEEERAEGELSGIVQTVWDSIEDALKVKRKKRYS
jgi:RecA/RadA recombinase